MAARPEVLIAKGRVFFFFFGGGFRVVQGRILPSTPDEAASDSLVLSTENLVAQGYHVHIK